MSQIPSTMGDQSGALARQSSRIASQQADEKQKERLFEPLDILGTDMIKSGSVGLGKYLSGKTGIKSLEGLATNVKNLGVTKGFSKTASDAVSEATQKGGKLAGDKLGAILETHKQTIQDTMGNIKAKAGETFEDLQAKGLQAKSNLEDQAGSQFADFLKTPSASKVNPKLLSGETPTAGEVTAPDNFVGEDAKNELETSLNARLDNLTSKDYATGERTSKQLGNVKTTGDFYGNENKTTAYDPDELKAEYAQKNKIIDDAEQQLSTGAPTAGAEVSTEELKANSAKIQANLAKINENMGKAGEISTFDSQAGKDAKSLAKAVETHTNGLSNTAKSTTASRRFAKISTPTPFTQAQGAPKAGAVAESEGGKAVAGGEAEAEAGADDWWKDLPDDPIFGGKQTSTAFTKPTTDDFTPKDELDTSTKSPMDAIKSNLRAGQVEAETKLTSSGPALLQAPKQDITTNYFGNPTGLKQPPTASSSGSQPPPGGTNATQTQSQTDKPQVAPPTQESDEKGDEEEGGGGGGGEEDEEEEGEGKQVESSVSKDLEKDAETSVVADESPVGDVVTTALGIGSLVAGLFGGGLGDHHEQPAFASLSQSYSAGATTNTMG